MTADPNTASLGLLVILLSVLVYSVGLIQDLVRCITYLLGGSWLVSISQGWSGLPIHAAELGDSVTQVSGQ